MYKNDFELGPQLLPTTQLGKFAQNKKKKKRLNIDTHHGHEQMGPPPAANTTLLW